MKIIYGIGGVKKPFKKAVLAIGVFDGLHRGHQILIQRAIREARKIQGEAVVMTFFPHPVNVLHPEINLPLIVSLKHRLKLLADLGVDACLVIHFTKSFSRLTPEQFIQRYLLNGIRPKEIFVGDDFRFGQNRTGTLDYFQEVGKHFGFKVNIVQSTRGGQKTASSTSIRQLISEGNLSRVGQLLGRRVSIMGTVTKGEARGQTLGYPTANIDPEGLVIPPLGVYAVYVMIGPKKFSGMANVGVRPSFKSHNNRVNVEVHIFNFHKNLYSREIVIEFIKKIRDEKFFNTKEKLIQQLEQDEHEIKSFFRR